MYRKIMRRTRLRNKFIDSKTDADRIAYNKQRNYYVSVLQKQKNGDVTENKTFWRKVKSLFSEKVNLQIKVLLVEKESDLRDLRESDFR